jgi:hypothetical protein
VVLYFVARNTLLKKTFSQGKKKKGVEVADDKDHDDDGVENQCVKTLSDSDTVY